MKELLTYQIEVAICLIAFSMVYLILWNKETNFQFKRFMLVSIPILSIVIPLLNIKISLATQDPVMDYFIYLPNQIILPSLTTPIPKTESINIWQILMIIWIIGTLLMSVRLLISYWRIFQIYKKSAVSEEDDYLLADDPIHSFSFFKLIVINKTQATTGSKEHILAHERAHSQQFHSIDVVLFETLKLVQWFNPFIWWLTTESKQNLEFLADQEATTSNSNKEHYQYSIIHHAANSGYQLLKSQFSKANLKNRIIMMNQPNNRKIKTRKLFVLLPVFIILFMSFSMKIENLDFKKELSEVFPIFNSNESNINGPSYITSIDKIENYKSDDYLTKKTKTIQDTSTNKVFHIVENQPKPSTGDMDSYYEVLYAELKYPEKAKQQGIKGKVFVQFIIQKDGILKDVTAVKGLGFGCDEEAVRVMKEGPKWIPGKQQGTPVNVRMIMPIKFGYDDESDSRKLSGAIVTEDGEPVIGCNVIIKGTTTGTVSDGNGRFLIEVEPENSELVFSYVGLESEIVTINQETKYNIVLKNDPDYPSSPNPQITKGKVAIGYPISVDDNRITIRGSQSLDDSPPLYILDGKEITKDGIKAINPNDIESVTVLKDKSATSIYGEKAENGVVLITSKKGNKSKSTPDYTDVTIIDDNNKDGLKLKTDGNLDFGENPPIFYIDGEDATEKEVEILDPSTIESISVLKGKAAKEKYGKKGKNGVVIIKMKE